MLMKTKFRYIRLCIGQAGSLQKTSGKAHFAYTAVIFIVIYLNETLRKQSIHEQIEPSVRQTRQTKCLLNGQRAGLAED